MERVKKSKWVILALLFLFFSSQSGAFNHPELKWQVIETPHFLVHYHQGEEAFASVVAEVAEDVYPKITSDLGYEPKRKTPVICRDTDEVSGGYTNVLTGTIVIQATAPVRSNTGDLSWARRVLAHEFTHVVTFASISESLFVMRRLLTSLSLPMWFIEGVAQYEGEGWDSGRDMVLRDAALDKNLMNPARLRAFYFFDGLGVIGGYRQSHSFFEYIFDTYGKENLSKVLASIKEQPILSVVGAVSTAGAAIYPMPMFPSLDKALKETVQKNEAELYKEWKESITGKYSKQVEGLDVEPLGDYAQRLTDWGGLNRHPVWSPDGKRIGFLSNRRYDYSTFDLYVMDADGKNLRRIAREANDFVSWSPDGKQMVYSKLEFGRRQNNSFLNDIYIVDVASKQKRRITRGLRASQPSWSPDGKQIAFIVHKGGNSNIYTMNPDGTDITPVTQASDGLIQNFAPGWSPDGKRIAFSSFRDGQRDIWLIRADGKDERPLVTGSADDNSPSWFPDGKMILFSSDRNGIFNLYTMSLESKKVRQITNLAGGAFEPAWSPDGQQIAFSAYEGGGFNIYSLAFPALRDQPQAEQDVSQRNQKSEKVGYPVHPYRAELRPPLMIPWFGWDEEGIQVTLQTLSSDILDKHTLWSSTGFGLSSGRFTGQLLYLNRQFGPSFYINPFYFVGRGAKKEETSDDIYTYWEERKGGGVGLSYPITDNQEIGLGFENRESEVVDIDPGDPRPWEGRTNSLSAYWGWDNVLPAADMDLNPSMGRRFTLSTEYADDDLGSKRGYRVYLADWREYLKLGYTKQTIAFKLAGGLIENQQAYPRETFLVGGVGSIRGYRGDYSEGERMALFNLEYRFPIFKDIGFMLAPLYLDRLYGALFVDIGYAWNSGEEPDFADFRKSGGLEFRLRTLLFGKASTIIGLGVAKGFEPEKSTQVFFSIGRPF